MDEARPSQRETAWTRWTAWFLGAALATLLALWGFVAVLDPFGLRVSAGQAPRPIMDINQRYMYLQLVRSGGFDSAVLGTSTMRLLDPAILSQGLGGRFANLAMNAATPLEQLQMAGLLPTRSPRRRPCSGASTRPGARLMPPTRPSA